MSRPSYYFKASQRVHWHSLNPKDHLLSSLQALGAHRRSSSSAPSAPASSAGQQEVLGPLSHISPSVQHEVIRNFLAVQVRVD